MQSCKSTRLMLIISIAVCCSSFCYKAMSALSVMPSGRNKMVADERTKATAFNNFVKRLKHRAQEEGISKDAIEKGLAGVHYVTRVVNFDRNQLEEELSLDGYLTRTMTPTIVSEGRRKFKQYHSQLLAVSEQYGVDAAYIVALWGVESRYGHIQGNEAVVSALATLAFEGRRRQYFTSELIAAIRLIDQQKIMAPELKGSWAGAMGQIQFMPRAFLRYATDGNGDGKIDIWNDVEDVFASAANYLAHNGWHSGERWGEQVELLPNFDSRKIGTSADKAKTIAQWCKEGVKLKNPRTSSNSQQRAWIIAPNGIKGRTFMIFDNFLALMNWNRSVYFALNVGMLADAITNGYIKV